MTNLMIFTLREGCVNRHAPLKKIKTERSETSAETVDI